MFLEDFQRSGKTQPSSARCVPQDVAARIGETAGGLLNATFGNVVEMLLCIVIWPKKVGWTGSQGSLNGTHFGGESRLMQIYGNVEGIFR